ncbi:unnamed protein product [Urochloa decumbens]|uniref:Uncharacterized protein n=1 Tax=Urochloa decumbens TaxID=240449 RepID=A0ABC9GDX2_9POAL
MEVRCRRLEGKVAVVTAYTQGIGLAIAERLRRRPPPRPVCPFVLLNSAAEEHGRGGGGAQGKGDHRVRGPSATSPTPGRGSAGTSSTPPSRSGKVLFNLRSKGLNTSSLVLPVSTENFGHIGILVSNAAANPNVDGILEMKEAVLDKLSDFNVKASILLLQMLLPTYGRGHASVLLFLQLVVTVQNQDWKRTCVTKAALFGLTKRKELTDRNPLKRLGSVECMAAAAAFLASDDASFITAETICCCWRDQGCNNLD